MHTNPLRILGLQPQSDTYIEVDMDAEWTIPTLTAYSKAKWTPFAGKQIRGAVHRVVLRGQVVCIEGKVLAEPGYGCDLRVPSMAKKVLADAGSQATMKIGAPLTAQSDVNGN